MFESGIHSAPKRTLKHSYEQKQNDKTIHNKTKQIRWQQTARRAFSVVASGLLELPHPLNLGLPLLAGLPHESLECN